jgi:short-subunit dehydrogenase
VFGKTGSIPASSARESFELNFWACSAAARSAARYWEARNRGGKFLAVLSIVARLPVPFEAYYAASKAAAARFLECLQLEYEPKKIEFLCTFPGMLRTPFRRQAEWYGLQPPSTDRGSDASKVARAIVQLLEGRRKQHVIGWRERGIDLADRYLPGLYNRAVLRPRARKLARRDCEARDQQTSGE